MDIFTRFKSAIKIRDIHIDNNVFQLHYRVTALLLLGCAALVASKQHFGDPIDCITRDDVPNKIMDTYCWIHATFTLPAACNRTVGTEIAHPCVDKSDNEERVYHKYYQWVYFVLFFQAVCFYAPHFFWKSCESKLLMRLCSQLQDPLLQKEEEKREHAMQVVTYLKRNRSRHQNYYYYFVIFEVINFLNVILQIYVVDAFLGGTFTTYGLDVLNYIQMDQDDRMDPMVRVFPRMTKCTFHRFGSSGDVQRYDALCILPLNIINEKIYIIMWFWFIFLAVVTGFWLVYRLVTFAKPKLRLEVLRRRANYAKRTHLRIALDRAPVGDWFLLNMLCKNMDSRWFRFIVSELAKQLQADRDLKEAQAARNNFKPRGGRNGRSNRFVAADKQPMMVDVKIPETSEDEDESDDNQSGGDDAISLDQEQPRRPRKQRPRGSRSAGHSSEV